MASPVSWVKLLKNEASWVSVGASPSSSEDLTNSAFALNSCLRASIFFGGGLITQVDWLDTLELNR